MITNKDDIADIVHDTLFDAYKKGIISQSNKDLSIDMLYPFAVEDIAGVYIYKKGIGSGTWFLLHDHSIWSAEGIREPNTDQPDYK